MVNLGNSGRADGLLRVLAPATLGLDRQTLAKVEGELRWLDRSGRTPFQSVAHCLCDY